MKKFELTTESIYLLGIKLFRIKALVTFGCVKKGELGGFVEKEENLDHTGSAWIFGNAKVYGNAMVYRDARVSGNAKVYGNARVYGNALVHEGAKVYGGAKVYEKAWLYGNAKVYGNALVHGDEEVSGNAEVSGNQMHATVKGFGSQYRNTTFFITRDRNICVNCGCFSGTLEQFRAKVKETHKDTKYAKEYLAIADLMEMHFKEELEKIKK